MVTEIGNLIELAASISAIVGIIIAIVWREKKAGLKYKKMTLNIVNNPREISLLPKEDDDGIKNSFPQLKIFIGEKECDRVSVTRVVVWNASSTMISKDDVPPANPIRVTAKPEYEIYQCRILYESDRGSAVRLLQSSSSEVTLDFDYLNPRDGFIAEFLHNGRRSSHLMLDGSVRGHRQMNRRQAFDVSRLSRWGYWLSRHPKFARIIIGILMATLAYWLFITFHRIGLGNFAVYTKNYIKAGQLYSLNQIAGDYLRFLILSVSLISGYLAIAVTLLFRQRLPESLRSFESRWPWRGLKHVMDLEDD